MKTDDSLIFVIFGASGDLARRKLIPALYSLYTQGTVPSDFVVIGASRTQYSDIVFREKMKESLIQFNEKGNQSRIDEFVGKLFYTPVNYDDTDSYRALKERTDTIRKEHSLPDNIIFYLSTPPDLYSVIPTRLAEVGLNVQDEGWKRVIIEKPFGYDLESAIALKNLLIKYWNEDQIYRIDHYLGKETVQNLLVTRFSNGIFEPLWNSRYIHHVEVTSAEDLGVERRGGYYDNSGALRDMIQNHLLQVVAITAMEPPASTKPEAIRNETLKVLQSLRPINESEVKHVAVRGQYTASSVKGAKYPGYREEDGVRSDSTTETYAALKFYIDNWRWGGVPFYIRTGKRLPARVMEIVINFKPTPHFLFSVQDECRSCNQLVIRIQPDEGIMLSLVMKMPGTGFEVRNVNMDFHYSDLTKTSLPSAYERLIHDAMTGDSTLFAGTEELLESWRFLMPVINAWSKNASIPLYGYPAGTWGPENADDLIEDKEMTWHYPCKNLTDDGIYCEL
ncbi:MAG: glucose-6-phosphate dehydrogenase [Bacteroidales bacterium]|nr:glucose-6-phosphate dehydrogenase [Bacteroidales bacterium]